MTAQASGRNPPINRKEIPIAYLIRRRFPSVVPGKGVVTPSPAEQADKAKYQADLMSLSESDLFELYRVEALKEKTERNRAEQEANIRKREAEAPWNKPESDAVWNDWIVDRWLIDEATALLHGKDPRWVSPNAIDDTRLGDLSPFVQSYRHLREMLSRAYDSGSLKPTPKERILSVPLSDWDKPPTVTPESVIEWALAYWVVPGSREVPPELLQAMQTRGRAIRNLRPIAAKAERVSTKGKVGRPAEWDKILLGFAFEILKDEGVPDLANHDLEWRTKADLTRKVLSRCAAEWRDEPPFETTRKKAASWIAYFRAWQSTIGENQF